MGSAAGSSTRVASCARLFDFLGEHVELHRELRGLDGGVCRIDRDIGGDARSKWSALGLGRNPTECLRMLESKGCSVGPVPGTDSR